MDQMWPLQRATQGGTQRGWGAGGGLGVALSLWKDGQAYSQVCHSQELSSPSLPRQGKSKTHKTLSSGSQQLFALLPKSAESHEGHQEPGFSQVSQVRSGHPCPWVSRN